MRYNLRFCPNDPIADGHATTGNGCRLFILPNSRGEDPGSIKKVQVQTSSGL